jgi:F420-dependent oxidoreductase-like protein
VRLSLNITNFSWPDGTTGIAARLAQVVRAAEDAGLDTAWVSDHLIQADPNSAPEAEMLEAYATLGFLSAHTTRIRLGTLVSGVTYRAPALLVKAITTVDVLSGGRAWLGIGAGYQQFEAAAMGLSLPPVAERFDRLEETLRLALQMWSGDDTAFEGAHYRLERPLSSPNSVQRPHPPILIGGMGKNRTLPLVARYGDACNLFDIPDGGKTVTERLEVLARHCAEIGRPYDAIDKTVTSRFDPAEPTDAFVDRCAGLGELGFQHVVVITNGPWTEPDIERLSEAVPAVTKLGTRP